MEGSHLINLADMCKNGQKKNRNSEPKRETRALVITSLYQEKPDDTGTDFYEITN